MKLKNAVEQFVRELNSIPVSFLNREDSYLLEEVEVLSTDKECYDCGCNEIENGKCTECEGTEYGNVREFPMWGTMWTFKGGYYEDWCRDNLDKLSDIGFWVYDCDYLGILIGIDGCGYDFYEAHWIPLYNALGLKWHDSED